MAKSRSNSLARPRADKAEAKSASKSVGRGHAATKASTKAAAKPASLAAKTNAKTASKAVPKPAASSPARLVPRPNARPEPMPRRALGRGLSALIPPAAATTSTGSGYRTLPIERLVPNVSQPRKTFDEADITELAHSIGTQGVLQPIIVRKQGEHYEIVAGERRWRAATRAGLREVPTIVKELSDSHALQIALIENIQRKDLDPLEEAQAYKRLLDEHDLTHEALAEAVGKNRVTITNSLRLLKLPDEVLALLTSGRLTAGHVRPLMTLPDERTMVRLAEEFVGRKLSVRDAETRAKQTMAAHARSQRGGRPTPKRGGGDSTAISHVAERLQTYLHTKVTVSSKGARGQTGTIEIHYHSLEGLDDILEKIMDS